ncbi:MAG: hypothetical protein JSS76_04425 [Bacteroidetes bacterium]|nr:hypothetical protein [Bacteroidota bacterium]
MTPQEKYLVHHPLFKDMTFDQFCNKLPVIYFKPNVHEDVLKNFDVIDHLLAHSYYDYRFIDEAFNKALATLEMAMNFRYNELNKKYHKVQFAKLAQFLIKKNQFDSHEETLDYYREMRNHHTHPKLHSFAGSFLWNHFERVAILINEMYDDTDLRIARKNLWTDTTAKLTASKLCSPAVIKAKQGDILAYRVKLVFVDNKSVPHKYHFSYTPLFDHQPIGDHHIQHPGSGAFSLRDVNFNFGTMSGFDIDDDGPLSLVPVDSEPIAFSEYAKWHEGYKQRKEVYMYENAINHNEGQLWYSLFKEFIKK